MPIKRANANRPLTPKENAFVEKLVEYGGDQMRAYRASYETKSKNKSTVCSEASRVLAKPHVWAKYCELQEKANKKNEQKSISRGAKVIEALESIGFDETYKPLERLKALELLGKTEQLFTDKVAVDADSRIDVSIEIV